MKTHDNIVSVLSESLYALTQQFESAVQPTDWHKGLLRQ